MNKPKIVSIETFRVFAIIGVICLHMRPFEKLIDDSTFYKYLFYFINNLCRFAVPFFFLTAGYFYGKKTQEVKPLEALLLSYLKKLGTLFISWGLIYTFIPQYIPLKSIILSGFDYDFYTLFQAAPLNALSKFNKEPLNFIFQGPSTPLWFLTALMMALTILTIFIKLNKQHYLIPAAVGFYILGLLISPTTYASTPLGIHLPFAFQARNGPFFSTLFVVIGWHLSRQTNLPSARTALALILGGFLFQEIECLLLVKFTHAALRFEYLIGTVVYGIGIFLLALSKPNIGQNTFLPKIGPLVLGIYVSHLMIAPYSSLIQSHFHFNLLTTQFMTPLFLLITSIIFVLILRKIPFTRFLVQ